MGCGRSCGVFSLALNATRRSASRGEEASIEALAELYGVETRYTDGLGRERQPDRRALEGILTAMGADLAGGVDFALATRRDQLATQGIEPVLVAWEGMLPAVPLSSTDAGSKARLSVRLEDGGELGCGGEVSVAGEVDASSLERLPFGVHELEVKVGGRVLGSHVISAPSVACRWRPRRSGVGVFVPLYALESTTSWGAGSLTELSALAGWAAARGADVIATLPLLASFPSEASPYRPASRLFWNEAYLDVEAVPEFRGCAAARELVESPGFREELGRLRSERWVDYDGLAALKQRVVGLLALDFFERGASERRDEFESFRRSRMELDAYAEFRASRESPAEGASADRHRYAQWVVAEQLQGTARGAAAAGVDLALDLPLGVHPQGYDVSVREELFCTT